MITPSFWFNYGLMFMVAESACVLGFLCLGWPATLFDLLAWMTVGLPVLLLVVNVATHRPLG